jgi:hypothetical protein
MSQNNADACDSIRRIAKLFERWCYYHRESWKRVGDMYSDGAGDAYDICSSRLEELAQRLASGNPADSAADYLESLERKDETWLSPPNKQKPA